MTTTGQCFCGQARLTTEADPVGARLCWCRDCQRLASGSATVNVLFPQNAVQFSGEIATLERTADSGNTVRRGFCPKCGSQMYAATPGVKDSPIRIRAGVLDDPELMAPQSIIWTDSAPSWAVLDPKLTHHPKGPK